MSNIVTKEEKACSVCKIIKPMTMFNKAKRPDGHHSQCKDCFNVKQRAYRKKNQTRTNKLARDWRLNNPDKVKEITKKHNKKRKDNYKPYDGYITHKVCSQCGENKKLEDYHVHPFGLYGRFGKCRICKNASESLEAKANKAARFAEWKEKNPNYHKEYREENRDRYLVHAANRRALERNAKIGEIPLDIREILTKEQDGMCNICETGLVLDTKTPHLDHIYPLSRGGAHAVFNFQMAHSFCNLRKGSKLPV